MKKIHFIISAAAVLGMAAPALADVIKDGRPTNQQRRDVRFGDLNLDTQEGMDRLNARIAVAVRYVCGSADNRIVREAVDMRNCRNQSMKQAFADRDALVAARLAARGQPGELAATTSISVGRASR